MMSTICSPLPEQESLIGASLQEGYQRGIGPATDRYGRRFPYLRLSIIPACNFRCTYCLPQELHVWLPREEILTFEETLRLIRIAAGLGVRSASRTGCCEAAACCWGCSC